MLIPFDFELEMSQHDEADLEFEQRDLEITKRLQFKCQNGKVEFEPESDKKSILESQKKKS